MKKFDVAIAGGGVIGGAIALELARAGLRVAVFDRQQAGRKRPGPAPESFPLHPKIRMVAMCHWEGEPCALSRICWVDRGDFRQERRLSTEGTLEALFSEDTKAELSTIIALHHGLGLKAETASRGGCARA